MLEKLCSLMFAALLMHTACAAHVRAQSPSRKDEQHANKIMRNILKLGTGPEARVMVKLRDKTVLVGFINTSGQDSFNMTDQMTGKLATVEYAQVKEVRGSNSRTGVIVGGGPGKVGNIFLKVVPMALGAGLAVFLVVDVLRHGDF